MGTQRHQHFPGRRRREPARIHGRVLDTSGAPVGGAVLDVWGTNRNGLYENVDPSQPDYNLRGRFRSGTDGGYDLWTAKPVSYPIPSDGPVGELLAVTDRHDMRPAHFHVIASANGYRTIVTELFTDDDPYLHNDAVFGVKPSLVVHYDRIDTAATLRPQAAPSRTGTWSTTSSSRPDKPSPSGSAQEANSPPDRYRSRRRAKPGQEGNHAKRYCRPHCVRCRPVARTSLPGRIVFGDGAVRQLADELDQRDLRRAMLIAADYDPSLAAHGREALGNASSCAGPRSASTFRELAARATTAATAAGVDVVVAIGGGSTTGLGKAIAVAAGLPLAVVPTTYAGSEMTPIYGLTSDGDKMTARDTRALPRIVVYDPRLLTTLPPAVVGQAASTPSPTAPRRCGPRTPTRSPMPSRSTASASSGSTCPPRTRPTTRRRAATS